jgi:hypothetical protein
MVFRRSRAVPRLAFSLIILLALSSCDYMLVPASSHIDPVYPPVSWKGAYADVGALAAAVRASAVAIEPDYGAAGTVATLPAGLAAAIAGHDIVLLGERHYMLEHNRITLALARALQASGYRAIAYEMHHAVGYIVDDYVTGARDDLPSWACYLQREIIAGLRAYNLTLPAADRVHLVNFDMNHDPSLYGLALYDHAAFRSEPCFSAILDSRMPFASEGYRDAVRAVADSLAANESAYRASWCDLWYDRAVRMTRIELASWDARRTDGDLAREDIIADNAEYFIARWGKVIISCGSMHAQKTAFRKSGDNGGAWLGTRLAAKYGDAVWSGLFLPARGSLPEEGNDGTCHDFDSLRNADDNDLMKIVSDSYPDMLVYLPFVAEPFLSYPVGLDHDVYVPAKTYDAFILYPRASSISFATGAFP